MSADQQIPSASQTKLAAAANQALHPHVVIVGAGFGGLAAAQALSSAPVQVTVIDRRNFHLFQPLLYQVATAALNPSDIAWPIRSVLRGQANAAVVLGEVTAVDSRSQQVTLADGRMLAYDHLILATGATHNYFGKAHFEAFAPGLKRIDDATLIRRRILMAFERAESCGNAEEQARLLSFVVVGAGPTGVELAGAIAELAHKALLCDFRRIKPTQARIVLVEGGPRVLAAFPEKLSAYTLKTLQRMGVEVQLGRKVIDCNAHGVTTDAGVIPAATVMWAAGIAASPAAHWLGVTPDRAGRVPVDAQLKVAGHANVYVIGDTAAMQSEGQPVPGIAPAAKQAGQQVARAIVHSIQGKPAPKPFRYRHFGSLATIGRNSAVIDWGRLQLTGWTAWMLWGAAHVYFLIGARHRFIVAWQWLFNYLTYARGARLIAGSDGREAAAAPAAKP